MHTFIPQTVDKKMDSFSLLLALRLCVYPMSGCEWKAFDTSTATKERQMDYESGQISCCLIFDGGLMCRNDDSGKERFVFVIDLALSEMQER